MNKSFTTVQFANPALTKWIDAINKFLASITDDGLIGVSGSTGPVDTSTLAKEVTLQLGVWDSIIGNSILYTHYTGIEAGNPSGNKDNIKTIEYQTASVTQITQTFTWSNATGESGDDQIISIITT